MSLQTRIQKLSLGLLDRLELYLVYTSLKSACQVFVRRKSDGSIIGWEKIEKWIADAGLKYSFSIEKKDCLFVSNNGEMLDYLSRKLYPYTEESEYRSGVMFGYPEEACKIYSQFSGQFTNPDRKKLLIGSCDKDSPIRNEKYALYARYVLRRGYELEDSKIAKKWMEIIKKDIPDLAERFEKSIKKALNL